MKFAVKRRGESRISIVPLRLETQWSTLLRSWEGIIAVESEGQTYEYTTFEEFWEEWQVLGEAV